jgi:hypothetical protein
LRSVEQCQEFQVARRVASLVAPGWRLLATPFLQSEEIAIDIRKKTIEIGEDTTKEYLLAGAMFAIGHVKLQNKSRFAEFFGNGLEHYSDDNKLISKLASQGVLADKQAIEWASTSLAAFWPDLNCSGALYKYGLRRKEWIRYFS